MKKLFLLASLSLAACGKLGSPPSLSPGISPTSYTPTEVNTATQTPSEKYETCHNSDPHHQCIGLKIVSYQSGTRTTVLDEVAAIKLVQEMNTVWGQCNIGFQLEKFESVDPTSRGLAFSPNWRSDSTEIRALFQESNTFLIVAVGPWTTSTIAVTQMPGYGPFGTLVEEDYAKNPLTVGHELGHYMGLYHYRSTINLMNPYIGPNTEQLTQNQCDIAQSTNTKNWTAMLR